MRLAISKPASLVAILSALSASCAEKPGSDARDGSAAATSTGPEATAASNKPAPAFASCLDGDEPGCKAKCDGGDAESCLRLARLYAFGDANVKADLPASIAAYTKACDAGLGKACYFLAGAHGSGRGTKADDEKKAELRNKAIPLLLAACDGDPGDAESCSVLADLHLTGEGLPKDSAKEEARRKQADALYGKACDRGDGDACFMFADSRILAKDGPGAVKAAKRGCDAGSGAACQTLAGIYAEGFEGVAAEPAKARELFLLACKRGLGASCARLGD